jgi:[ribosomal protein S18]-alanine N-acetyltransferase
VTLLREATRTDLDALVALETAVFGPVAWSRPAMTAELAALGDTRIILVAESAGDICGYGILLATGGGADVQRIAVSTSHRRSGVGSRLLAALLERCAGAGLDPVLLEVAADNLGAIAFYHRHGFGEIARRARYYADGRDALVMRRKAPPPEAG